MYIQRNKWIPAALAGMALLAAAFHPRVAANKGFAVVELFTSEGCSSCPPADALVASVQKEDKDLPVYVLAYHVDYWDRLGWKDAFSDAACSQRQKEYAQWLHLSSIYTPQVIVNGQKEFVGSDANSLHQAIDNGLRSEPTARLALNAIQLKDGKLNWQAHADATGGSSLRIVVALVQHDAHTKIMGGENNGKTIAHVQIVRSFEKVPLDHKGNATGQAVWPAGLSPSDGEVIAFLQDRDHGQIIAACRASVR